MKGRAVLAAAALAAAAAGLGTTAAHATDTVIRIPAPPGSASGTGATVGGVISIGQTGATATQQDGTANAVSLSVAGKTIIGGTQSGTGQTSGALLDTKNTPLGRVQVAPYSASVTQDGARRQADASSAAARADVLNPDVVHVDVLQSSSSATHTGPLSAGHAVSDGVVVRVGGPSGTTIRILHSEANSNGQGRTYLLAIGDNAVIDGTVLDPVCALNLNPLLDVACMTVSGGVGGLTATDLNAVVAGLTATAVTSSAANGVSSVLGTEISRSLPADVASTNGHGLARTGHNVWFMMFVAEALIALGLATLATAKALNLAYVRTERTAL